MEDGILGICTKNLYIYQGYSTLACLPVWKVISVGLVILFLLHEKFKKKKFTFSGTCWTYFQYLWASYVH